MGLENYNIVDIENALTAKIKTLNITANLYPSARPSVVPSTGMTEFLVIRASTDIDDRNAYGTIMTVVEIYVKDAGNLPSRARISSIRNTIATVLPYISTKYDYNYFTDTPMRPDGNGYTFQIIKLFTLIK